jgi:hypothetical protein
MVKSKRIKALSLSLLAAAPIFGEFYDTGRAISFSRE